jgi:hypothetical protein
MHIGCFSLQRLNGEEIVFSTVKADAPIESEQ